MTMDKWIDQELKRTLAFLPPLVPVRGHYLVYYRAPDRDYRDYADDFTAWESELISA